MKERTHSLADSLTCVDAIVIGMGPAGASAAYELAQRGMSVLAFDKQVHPRYKVCGGGLSARIERILPADFKTVVEQTVYRIEFIYGGKESFYLEFPQPVAYMVMRPQFDRWFVGKAVAAGVMLHEGESVISLRMHDDGVDVNTDRGRYQARFVIGADGVKSLVAQHLFPGSERPKTRYHHGNVLYLGKQPASRQPLASGTGVLGRHGKPISPKHRRDGR